jgi:hypothetical protein
MDRTTSLLGSDSKLKDEKANVTSVILGAGFSHVAGLPLTKDLFGSAELPKSFSRTEADSHKRVALAYKQWAERTGETNAELWLKELYYSDPSIFAVEFNDAIRFAMARLVILHKGNWRTAPYMHGITRSVESVIHRRFWTEIRNCFNLKSVVSMNYDILAEQGLKLSYCEKRTPPLCHYGGFPARQFVKKLLDVRTRAYEDVQLGSEIAMFKMHGSINWCDEPHGFKIHDDVRGVFRTGSKYGTMAIVPPIPGKDGPPWLTKVWEYAARNLRISTIWIICGYSMPDYDDALKKFFFEAAVNTPCKRVFILDPNSEALVSKWRVILPSDSIVIPLKGLPEGLRQLIELQSKN